MKKLIIAALLFVGLNAVAQEGKVKGNRPGMEKMSPEQRNQLMVKKMTLDLDLNAKQQEQVKQIIAEQGTKREAMKAEMMAKKQSNAKPTTDEQFAMRSKMLDEQIAMQNKMKTILTQDQFNEWRKNRERSLEKKHKGNFGKRNPEKKEVIKN